MLTRPGEGCGGGGGWLEASMSDRMNAVWDSDNRDVCLSDEHYNVHSYYGCEAP